jgi:molybdopterin converting factor small subunit
MSQSSSDEAYNKALKDVQRDLESARSVGGHLVWLGYTGALTIVGGIAVSVYALLGHEAFLNLDPIWLLAGGLLAAGPAMASIVAGYMARQSLRTSRANRLVLRASQMLLLPADVAGKRLSTLGAAVREETGKIDELIEGSHASLAELRESLRAERLEIARSVEDNNKQIRDMIETLADERQALAELTSAVDAQASAMSDAIPRQARIMAEAARAAQMEVAKADDALQSRLEALDQSAVRLGESIAQLSKMSKQGENNAMELINSIASVETRLQESAKVVDAAIRASELAASAASETGDSLNAAVASALDGTREASTFIRQQSREAVAEAMKAMSELKQAGEQAKIALAAAGVAARAEADETEQRIDQMSNSLFQTASRASSAVEAGLERARLRMERASAMLTGALDIQSQPAPPVDDPREQFTAPPPVTSTEGQPPPNGQASLRPRQAEEHDIEDEIEDDDFDLRDEDHDLTEPLENKETESDGPVAAPENQKSEEAPYREWDTRIQERDEPEFDLEEGILPSSPARDSGLSWRDLLAGLDTPAEERDESARYMLSEIEQSGIDLNDLFKPKMVKKISGAARRGERNRRRLVREYAGQDVQTLIFRLQDDTAFRNSTDRFLTVEEPDALRTLAETEKSRSSASPRLTAYLLLDAAVSAL